jgi:hypothetical protein
MSTPTCIQGAAVDAYLDGHEPMSPATRDHLADCRSCRERFERRVLFERLTGRRGSVDRVGRSLGLLNGPLGLGARRIVALAGAVAAAASIAIALRGTPSPTAPEFASRGPNDPVQAAVDDEGIPIDAPYVRVYQVDDAGRARRVADTITRDAALGFTYGNAPKPYLMLFAEDEAGEVHFYEPAWTRADQHPVSVTAQRGSRIELGEATRHLLVGSTLRIHALFSDQPLSAESVERRLLTDPRSLDSDEGSFHLTMVYRMEP